MKVNTTRFGQLILEDEKIIDMPAGMLGFPDKRRFVILKHGEDSPFFWYQCVDDPGLAFVITNPSLFDPKYKVDFSEALKTMTWDLAEMEHILVYVVVNIPKGCPEKMTGNFIGPILINQEKCQAVQTVIANSPYSHRYSLLKTKKTVSHSTPNSEP
jgi:flagellar assembly factor FliW